MFWNTSDNEFFLFQMRGRKYPGVTYTQVPLIKEQARQPKCSSSVSSEELNHELAIPIVFGEFVCMFLKMTECK